jgi:methylmalonyl-CoA carboxyltransferase small subunit
VKLKITVENKTYEVDVEAEQPEAAPARGWFMEPGAVRVPAAAPLAAGGPPPGPSDANEEKVCRSPMSGIVVKVSAQAGQKIQPGDILLVLEAMKMETNITAPIAGTIAKMNVNVTDGVKAGQVLVEFE